MAPAIFAWVIDVELMRVVLYSADTVAAAAQFGYDFFYQSCLAAVGFTDYGNDRS